jgi:hypothetical protein
LHKSLKECTLTLLIATQRNSKEGLRHISRYRAVIINAQKHESGVLRVTFRLAVNSINFYIFDHDFLDAEKSLDSAYYRHVAAPFYYGFVSQQIS